MPWPSDYLRRASINNFGYGGTNSHVIMEGPPLREQLDINAMDGVTSKERESKVIVLSANDELAAKSMVSNLKDYLTHSKLAQGRQFFDNMAYTLGERRSRFNWTAAVPARNVENLIDAIEEGDLKPIRSQDRSPRLGFVFTGQGAQWYGMGRELFAAYPVYADSLREADECLRRLGAQYSLIGIPIDLS